MAQQESMAPELYASLCLNQMKKKKQQQKLHSFGIAKHGAEPETKSQTSGFVARSGAQLEFNTAG